MSANGIAHLANKQAKQLAKLELAQKKRQGYTLYANGNVASGPDTGAVFYRAKNTYDITQLPTEYSGIGNGLIDNPNTDGLIEGRPWIIKPVIVTSGLRLYLDAGNAASYIASYTVTVRDVTDGGTKLHIPKVYDANIGNEISVGYPVATQWGGYHALVTNISTGTGGMGAEWIITIDTNVGIGFAPGSNVTFGSGTTWTDLSSNNNNATLFGSPAFTSAGTSSYFTFPNDGNKYASTSYTKYSGTYTGKTTFFVARINDSMADGYHAIFGATPDRTFNTYIYKNGANGQIHASFGSGGGLSSSFALATNQWFTFGITQNSNTISYYLNGQAVGVTTSQPLGTTYSSNTDPQWIGKADNFWYGDIAIATAYDRALSGAEMSQNHNAVVGRYSL